MINLMVESEKALKHARAFAKSGNEVWTQIWIDRAEDFFPVTQRRKNNLMKLARKNNTEVRWRLAR